MRYRPTVLHGKDMNKKDERQKVFKYDGVNH